MKNVPKLIVELSQELKEGELSRRYRVRAILKWFGASRRGAHVLNEIDATLRHFGMMTEPPFNSVGIDEQVRFGLSARATSIVSLDTQTDNPAGQTSRDAVVATDPANVRPDLHSAAQAIINEDELEPENGDEQPVLKPDDRPITSQICDWTISALRDKLDRGQLDLQPKFQREYVWALRPELPSRLIESLFLEIPIPPIYFGKVVEGHLEVIDGQQRLTTLVNYVTNKFALRKLNRMSSLNDKCFKDLNKEQQEKILDTPIRSIVIDAAGNTELRYEIFERLNRGSMALNEQELRNCVYRGPFNELLAELEKETYWRKAKGSIEPEGRFKEREMILRVFAFANRLPQYTGNLKHFLNEYMGQYGPQEEQQLRAHAAFFKQTVQNIYAVFGEKAARLYEVNRNNKGSWDTKFSITALDIQFAALMNRPAAKVQQVAEQIRELFLFTMLTDSEMQDAISKRTGSTAQTVIRWTKFRKLVDPIIDGALIEPRFFEYRFRKELFDKSAVCALCSNEIHSFEDSTVDHILPYSKGGKTVHENGQLAHRACNARKNAQIPTPLGMAAVSGN